jgi:mannose-1-phosphate guanylyltransferase
VLGVAPSCHGRIPDDPEKRRKTTLFRDHADLPDVRGAANPSRVDLEAPFGVFTQFLSHADLARYSQWMSWQAGFETIHRIATETYSTMSGCTTPNQAAGIVLVGTHPWTNSAFERLLPRTLLPVAHRPLISYALSWLCEGGIRTVAVCANRETQALESQLLRHVPPGMTLSYHEDPMPRGAAGSLRDAAAASDADIFVVADGTAIPTAKLADLLLAHRASGAAVTVVVHSEPCRNGNPREQVPSGMYVFNRQALDVVPDSGFYDIKEHLLPQLHRAGERVIAYPAEDVSPRVLDASSYLAVNEWMVERLLTTGAQPEGYVRTGDCLFHRDAVIADDAVFVGSAIVGSGAQIMSGAVIVGPSSIGCDATVGHGALVSRSAIWRRCVLGEQAVADRCIVADDTVLDAHTQAFRAVRVTSVRRERRIIRDETLEARETGSLEMFRRLGRILTGATWSRSASVQ